MNLCEELVTLSKGSITKVPLKMSEHVMKHLNHSGLPVAGTNGLSRGDPPADAGLLAEGASAQAELLQHREDPGQADLLPGDLEEDRRQPGLQPTGSRRTRPDAVCFSGRLAW